MIYHAGVLPRARTTGRYLVGLRSFEVDESGTWSGFGGKIEKGETAAGAAEREFREETGYPGEVSLEPFFVFRSYKNFIGHVEEEFVPRLNWENDGYLWLTARELEELTNKHPGLSVLVRRLKVRPHARRL